MRICQFCKAPGAVNRQYYTGGRGYIWYVECFDLDECGKRIKVQQDGPRAA